MKNIRIFYLKIFIVLMVKFSVYLNRYVFVMNKVCLDCVKVPSVIHKTRKRGPAYFIYNVHTEYICVFCVQWEGVRAILFHHKN